MPKEEIPKSVNAYFEECPACPLEVRGLYAVAFNLLNLRSDPDRWQRKIGERLAELEDAVAKMTPIVEAHFANDEHARRFGLTRAHALHASSTATK